METLLVVESEAITRCCWSERLGEKGYKVLQAGDSTEASGVMASCSDMISGLILEIFLSDAAAKELAQRMKRTNPTLCVIALSTLDARYLPTDFPYDAAVSKPVSANKIAEVVQHLLTTGQQGMRQGNVLGCVAGADC